MDLNVSRRIVLLSAGGEGEEGRGKSEGKGDREFGICVGKCKIGKGGDDQQPMTNHPHLQIWDWITGAAAASAVLSIDCTPQNFFHSK